MKGVGIKKKTETMVCAAQEQAIRVNLIRNYIDGHNVSAMCRLGGKSSETVKHGIPTGNKWYVHNVVTEADDGKIRIYRDKPIKTDRKATYNKPDVVVIDREENTWYIVDFAIPMDHNVKEKTWNRLISTPIWKLRLQGNLG